MLRTESKSPTQKIKEFLHLESKTERLIREMNEAYPVFVAKDETQQVRQLLLFESRTEKLMREMKELDVRRASDVFYTGYWGWVVKKRFAFLPTDTADEGWVWFKKVYEFKTIVESDRSYKTWQTQGLAVSPFKLCEIKREYMQSDI